MSATADAYRSLAEAKNLGASLRSPDALAGAGPVLTQVISLAEGVLRDAATSTNMHLLAEAHMVTAAAWVDAAFVDSEAQYREAQIATGLDHLSKALELSRQSGTTVLPTIILPWALVVLTGAMRTATGDQLASIERLHSSLVMEVGEALAAHKRACVDAGLALASAQMFLQATVGLPDPAERVALVQQGLDMAREARNQLLDAGAIELAREARETIATAEADLAKPNLWRPTHVVPSGGMDAWEVPDPTAAPVAQLGAGLEIRVVAELGAWSRALCSNGWAAWVDGRSLVTRP